MTFISFLAKVGVTTLSNSLAIAGVDLIKLMNALLYTVKISFLKKINRITQNSAVYLHVLKI